MIASLNDSFAASNRGQVLNDICRKDLRLGGPRFREDDNLVAVLWGGEGGCQPPSSPRSPKMMPVIPRSGDLIPVFL